MRPTKRHAKRQRKIQTIENIVRNVGTFSIDSPPDVKNVLFLL